MKNYLVLATLLFLPHNLLASLETSQGIADTVLMLQDMKIRGQKAQHFKNTSLKDVENFLKDNTDIAPQETIVVLDLDGTLTNQSNPQKAFGAEPRGNAINFVKDLVEKEYKLVISSAWPHFEETLQRVRDIGLSNTLQARSTDPLVTDADFPVSEDFTRLTYARKGLVTSVKADDREKFYINKAFSFSPTYTNLSKSTIKRFVFADDSQRNITHVTEDYKSLGAYFHADCILYTFLLTRADGQKDLE